MGAEKKIWFAKVWAIDSGIARAENRARAKIAPAELGWTTLIAECRAYLEIDVAPLCAEFDRLHVGFLPVGMFHVLDEPVSAHFTHHQCCEHEPPEPACALARSLFVFGQAARALRPEGWRRALRQELVRELGHEQAQEASYVQLVEQLKQAMVGGPDEQLEKTKFSAGMQKLADSSQARRLYVERLLQELKGPPALVGARDNARPALVLAESELMRGGHYKPAKVATLIDDQRNESSPRRQVQRRIDLARWTLALSLAR